MTPAGIEPATFRFVAQHLNHCATAVPELHVSIFNIWWCFLVKAETRCIMYKSLQSIVVIEPPVSLRNIQVSSISPQESKPQKKRGPKVKYKCNYTHLRRAGRAVKCINVAIRKRPYSLLHSIPTQSAGLKREIWPEMGGQNFLRTGTERSPRFPKCANRVVT